MSAVSSPSRQKSWRPGRERVSVLAELALRKELVSRRLTELREEHGLSQERAAGRVGVTVRQWQRWESGNSVPYPRNFDAIAEAFGISVAEFFDGSHDGTAERPVSQLDRIEAALQERVEHDKRIAGLIEHQNRLLADQTDLLTTIRTLVAALGMPDGTTIQDHLVGLLRDAAAQAGAPSAPTTRS